MTIEDPVRYVSTLTSYLSPNIGAKHRDAVRAELKAFLPECPRNNFVIRSLLLLGDPSLIEPYLATHGTDALRDLSDFDGDPISPWKCIGFNEIEPAYRIDLFDLVFNAVGIDGCDLLNLVARKAAYEGDASFFEHVINRLELDQQALRDFLTHKLTIEQAHPDVAAILAGMIERAGFSENLPEEFPQNIARRSAMRTTAVLMKLRLMPRRTIEEYGGSASDSAFARLLARLNSSNHFEIEFYANLPDVVDILKMTPTEATLMLSGPSRRDLEKQEKQRIREERIARTRAHFAAKGEPSPV